METRISYDVESGAGSMRECGFALGKPIKGTLNPITVRVPVRLHHVQYKPYSFRMNDRPITFLWHGVPPDSYEVHGEEEFAVFILDPNRATRS